VRPVVMYTRPACWQDFESDKLDLRYVPLTGRRPRRKSGRLAGPDGQMALANRDGIELLISELKAHKPQVLLRGVNTGMPKRAHERIREASPNTVVVCMDGNEPNGLSAHARRFGGLVDVFLLNSKDAKVRRLYLDAGYKHVDTLYDGVSPRDHKLNVIGCPNHDCFFGGSNRRTKIRDPEDVKKNKEKYKWKWDFPGGEFRFDFISHIRMNYKLRLHGSASEWPFAVEPVLHYPAYFSAFQTAKVVLGCNQYELDRYYPRRVMHAGVSGRAFVTKYIPGMEKDFGENGEHIAWFRTVEEGVETVGRYLKEDNRRKAMAARCRRLFLKRHTWEARLREFEKIVGKFV